MLCSAEGQLHLSGEQLVVQDLYFGQTLPMRTLSMHTKLPWLVYVHGKELSKHRAASEDASSEHPAPSGHLKITSDRPDSALGHLWVSAGHTVSQILTPNNSCSSSVLQTGILRRTCTV